MNRTDVRGGYPIAGFKIGILCPRSSHPLEPGNVQNATSFEFPVLYEIVDIADPTGLMAGDPVLADTIVTGAQNLQRHGVSIIVGSCGSFAFYQEQVASAVEIPVFMSVMLQVPLLLAGIPRGAKLGIIAGSAASITPELLLRCGVADPSRLVICDMKGSSEFQRLLSQANELVLARLRAETIEVAAAMCADHPNVAAILLQCSDLPPYARDIVAAMGRAVFDMSNMITWLQRAAAPPHYP